MILHCLRRQRVIIIDPVFHAAVVAAVRSLLVTAALLELEDLFQVL